MFDILSPLGRLDWCPRGWWIGGKPHEQSRPQSNFHHWQFLRLGSRIGKAVCVEGLEGHRLHAHPNKEKELAKVSGVVLMSLDVTDPRQSSVLRNKSWRQAAAKSWPSK
jgi:hypothetical protein